jgi:predicted RNA-binding Zn ribbon-like protein
MGGGHIFELVGGRLCLDFANTVSTHYAAPSGEKLPDYATLLVFAEEAGAISPAAARALLAEAARRPAEAERVLADAIALREALFMLCHARAGGPAPGPAPLELFNRHLGTALARQRLVPGADGYALRFPREDQALDSPLWPIVRSAADLLVDESARVRMCAAGSERCTWLFVDESKNHSRRWCSMRDCGNRMKARRHYEREKSGS